MQYSTRRLLYYRQQRTGTRQRTIRRGQRLARYDIQRARRRNQEWRILLRHGTEHGEYRAPLGAPVLCLRWQ